MSSMYVPQVYLDSTERTIDTLYIDVHIYSERYCLKNTLLGLVYKVNRMANFTVETGQM